MLVGQLTKQLSDQLPNKPARKIHDICIQISQISTQLIPKQIAVMFGSASWCYINDSRWVHLSEQLTIYKLNIVSITGEGGFQVHLQHLHLNHLVGIGRACCDYPTYILIAEDKQNIMECFIQGKRLDPSQSRIRYGYCKVLVFYRGH